MSVPFLSSEFKPCTLWFSPSLKRSEIKTLYFISMQSLSSSANVFTFPSRVYIREENNDYFLLRSQNYDLTLFCNHRFHQSVSHRDCRIRYNSSGWCFTYNIQVLETNRLCRLPCARFDLKRKKVILIIRYFDKCDLKTKITIDLPVC